MSTVRRIARRWTWLFAGALVFLFVGIIWGANVVTDGDMELAGITNWTLANVTGTNSSAKATDWKVSGAQSLKGTSAAGKAITVEWYNWQQVGTINVGDTVTLSLQYAFAYSSVAGGVTGTLYADISPNGTTWTTIWSQAIAPSTTRQTGQVSALDVGALVPSSSTTYRLRLRFAGKTGNVNGATINVWWDDVAFNVSAPAPIATTIGTGSEPPNLAGVCPGDGTKLVDSFTLSSNRNSTVSAVSVALAAGTAQGLSVVEIVDDGETASYGSVSNPSGDTFTIPLTSNITSTTTSTQYHIRVTPKSGANMPTRPGAIYNVTARVSGITSDATTVTNNDAAGTTVSIDNESPSAIASLTGTAGDGYVDLSWSLPAGADQVVVIRSTAAITDLPNEGQTYTIPTTMGASQVVYVGSATTWRDNGVTNGATYYYRIFAKDICLNYSAAADSGAQQPQGTPHLTTVGDGTDPSPSPVNLCPGDGATMLDAFTLTAAVGTDTVTGVQVTLAAGTSGGIALVEITNDAGAFVYGSIPNPSSDIVVIPINSPYIPVTTSTTQYKVRITPRSALAMPPNAGSVYPVTGKVTSVTSADPKDYRDTDSATANIDNSAPSTPVWGSVVAGDSQLSLQWTNPGSFESVMIARSTSTITAAPAEGSSFSVGDPVGAGVVVRYVGVASSSSDTSLTNGTTYYYRIFARDGCGNWSAGAETSGTPTSILPGIRVSAGTATVDSCTQLTARVSFSGDQPSNSTTKFERATTVNGPWTTVCDNVTGASPRTCSMGSLTAATTYYVRVTVTDPDGVTGQNPQIVGPVTTPAVCAAAATTAGTASVSLNSCKQATVTAPFSGDGDSDGSVLVEYNTTNSWPGTTACSSVTGGSPRSCIIPGLNASASYWFRVTYSDPDGVSAGVAQQTIGPLTTAACGADTTAPMILFLSPGRDAVVGGNERFKVQIFDAGGLAGSNPVRWAKDADALSPTGISVNANYACGVGCAVYEFTLATDGLANGAHSVTVSATDAAGNVGSVAQPFVASNRFNLPFGSGTILRRTHSAQLCMDCHAIQMHSSQSTQSTKYGSWAVDCLSCHTAHGTTNIGLVKRQIRTPNSGLQIVDFRALDKTGGTNPQYGQLGAYDPSGAPFNDGICEVCHTKTGHYRNDASGGDHTHNQGSRCTSCHTHTAGFKGAGCNGCHNSPPSVGKHRTKHDEVWDSTDGKTPTSYDDNTSHGTATQYGFACAKCHAGTHRNDDTVNPTHDGTTTNPWQVEVAFNGANASGSYSGTYKQSVDKPFSDNFSWSNGTCSNTYCHSNASPVGGTNASVPVTWSGTATTCSSCHKTGGFGDTGSDSTWLSKSHNVHIKSTSGETNTYAFKCNNCHAGVIVASPNDPWALTSADLNDKTLHVNESKQDVAFPTVLGSYSIDQSGGIYDGSTKTCGGTYCHSPGNKTSSFDPPNVSLAWGQTATCRSCHSGNATTAPTMASGKHSQHVNIAATFGNNIGCLSCHAATVSDDSTISAAGYANHVNGTHDVSGTDAGTWGGSGTPTCTSSRCHSSGVRVGTIEYYTMNWSTGPAITDCKGCHGRHSDNAFTSVAGEPNYSNVPASNKYNSHRAHVTSAADCHSCHSATVGTSNKIDGTNPAKHMDFDGVPDITFAAPYSSGTYNAATRQCTVGCHGTGAPTWGGASMVCGDCHLATADSDNWAINDNVISTISSTEWTTYGHGTSAIALPGTNPCLYCHTTAVGHKDSSNPFRLANNNATGDGVNSVCLVCHKTGSSGYNPGSGLKNGTKKIDAYHAGVDHTSTANGGERCWDCHDPHGDTNGTTGNLKMIGKTQMKSATDTWGISGTRTTGITSFTAMTTGTDFAKSATPFNGICNVCHTTTAHYTSTAGDSHYLTQLCTDCHKHNQAPNNAFRPGGGDCLTCHGTKTQGTTPVRRAVTADFSLNSHHVGTGGTMGGTLTNFDCVVCHAEGTVNAGATIDTAQHMNGVIDLRNADSTTAFFTYDKDAVSTSAGAAANWNSGNATWRTQTSTALDPFCLSCHDSNGASATYTLGDTGAVAQNPFKDTAVTNNYDQLTRPYITDIKSKVSGAPPTQGTFARHAIRGQSTSIYTKYQTLGGTYKSIYEFGGFTNMGSDENAKPVWNDTSVMGCADCHTTDGANGTTGNAHGANSEYLLKDANGAATKGTGTTTTSTYICVRCHINSKYTDSAGHTGSSSDYQDSVGLIGSLRTLTSRGTGTNQGVFGMACMNCHGGAPGINDGTNGFGWIHGTNQVFRTGASGGTGTRNAYRFTNGGGLRYYAPGSPTWDTTAGTCYTLASNETWSSCTQHASTSKPLTKPFARPLNY